MRLRWPGCSTIWLIPNVVTPSWRRSATNRSSVSGSSRVREVPSSMAGHDRTALEQRGRECARDPCSVAPSTPTPLEDEELVELRRVQAPQHVARLPSRHVTAEGPLALEECSELSHALEAILPELRQRPGDLRICGSGLTHHADQRGESWIDPCEQSTVDLQRATRVALASDRVD